MNHYKISKIHHRQIARIVLNRESPPFHRATSELVNSRDCLADNESLFYPHTLTSLIVVLDTESSTDLVEKEDSALWGQNCKECRLLVDVALDDDGKTRVKRLLMRDDLWLEPESKLFFPGPGWFSLTNN